jgi:hypothetical protein
MIQIITTKDGYMVQHMDGELEGEYLCDANGDNLFQWHREAEAVMYAAFDKDPSLMTDDRAFLYYSDKLAKHGWHIAATIGIEDVKDRINGGTDIVEMPSDEVLNQACARVARKYSFEDYRMCTEWAAELAMQYAQEETQ